MSKKINKNIKIFIQINIGDEAQKSGVEKQQSSNLIKFCLDNSLDIQGLMCLHLLEKTQPNIF